MRRDFRTCDWHFPTIVKARNPAAAAMPRGSRVVLLAAGRAAVLWTALLGVGASAEAQNLDVIHGFTPRFVGDGAYPYAGLVEGTDGALYGTTTEGGVIVPHDHGTVFRINKDGTGFLRLHDFNGDDGAHPWAGLVQATNDAFYGTTVEGPLVA